MEKFLRNNEVLVARPQLSNPNQLELEMLLPREVKALLPLLGTELLFLIQRREGLTREESHQGDLGLSLSGI